MENWNNHSPESETAVLAACIAAEDNVATAATFLDGKEFYDGRNSAAFKAIVTLFQKGVSVDAITLADQLRDNGTFDTVGGYPFVSGLIDTGFRKESVEDYAKTVHDKWVERRVVDTLESIATSAKDNKYDSAADLISSTEGAIFGLSSDKNVSETEHAKEIIWRVFEQIEERVQNPESISGIPTGYRGIDSMTTGLKGGQLIIVAGRPAMGKTSLAMNIAANAAITHGTPVIIFSLEMSSDELTERMLSSESEVDSQRIRKGLIREEDNESLARAGGIINTSPIYINDDAALTPLTLKSKLRRAVMEHDVQLAVVDYIQLMSVHGGGNGSNRNAEISEISRQLKIIARDLDIPIIAISQLNRAPEMRDNPRPIMSDLRESGAIEQNADIVMFVFREEYYTGPITKDGKDVRGAAEIIIAKQRNGPVGKIALTFKGEYTKFVNASDN